MPAASVGPRGDPRTVAAIAAILSHPFRLALDGTVAKVEQTSDAGAGEQIAVLCLTRPGERPLVPGFGLADPTFDGFQPSALAAALALWGPEVGLEAVDISQLDEATQRVDVSFR